MTVPPPGTSAGSAPALQEPEGGDKEREQGCGEKGLNSLGLPQVMLVSHWQQS